MGRYARDRNIEIEGKYGKEWLAVVMSAFNPVTGLPCIRKEHSPWLSGMRQKYTEHEYRFETTSDGWIARPGSDYAEATDATTFGELEPRMVCRECGDIYVPADRPKITFESYVTCMAMWRYCEEIGPVDFTDKHAVSRFVVYAAAMAAPLSSLDKMLEVAKEFEIPNLQKAVQNAIRINAEFYTELLPFARMCRGLGAIDTIYAKCKAIQAARTHGAAPDHADVTEGLLGGSGPPALS